LNIDDCAKRLESAALAIESAPQKGFINLDYVKSALHDSAAFLDQIKPQLELGDRLAADLRNDLARKLSVIARTGGAAFVAQAEQALIGKHHDYSVLKLLQNEIDDALLKTFGGYSKAVACPGAIPRNPDKQQAQQLADYR